MTIVFAWASGMMNSSKGKNAPDALHWHFINREERSQ